MAFDVAARMVAKTKKRTGRQRESKEPYGSGVGYICSVEALLVDGDARALHGHGQAVHAVEQGVQAAVAGLGLPVAEHRGALRAEVLSGQHPDAKELAAFNDVRAVAAFNLTS